MKHRPFPALCERCDQKITDQIGWGVLVICAIQPQPNAEMEPRENGMHLCGYCLHELARWVCPDEEAT